MPENVRKCNISASIFKPKWFHLNVAWWYLLENVMQWLGFPCSLLGTSCPSWLELPSRWRGHAHGGDSRTVPWEVRAGGDPCSSRWDFWPIMRYCSRIYRWLFWSYRSSAERCQFSSGRSILQIFWPELMFISLLIPKPLLQHFLSFDNPLMASFPSLSLAHLSSYVQA